MCIVARTFDILEKIKYKLANLVFDDIPEKIKHKVGNLKVVKIW